MDDSEKVFAEANEPWRASKEKVGPGKIFGDAPEVAPIQPGDIFDPDAELKEVLKTSGKEREEKFRVYRERFHYQEDGFSRMYEELWDAIKINPDASSEELLTKATPYFDEYGFSAERKTKIFIVISEYLSRRADIRGALGDISKNGEVPTSGEEYFKGFFGEKPKGKVEILSGPMSVLIRCYDGEDYERAIEVSGTLVGDDAETIKKRASGTRACKLRKTFAHALEDVITIENYQILSEHAEQSGSTEEESKAILKKESETNFLHEEQHAVAAFFKRLEMPLTFPSERDIIEAESEDERYAASRIYFKDFLPLFYSESKDEILARMSEGLSAPDLSVSLEDLKGEFKSGRFYDMRVANEKYIEESVYAHLPSAEIEVVKKAADEIFGEKFERTLDEAIDAVIDLLKTGFEPRQIKSKLLFSPLDKWKKEISRFLAGAGK